MIFQIKNKLNFLLIFFVLCSFGTQLLAEKPIFDCDGFDFSSIDHSVNPGDDFYQYAVGEWVKNNEIPPGFPRWGAFMELRQRSVEQLKEILNSPLSKNPTHDELLVKTLYSSYLDMDQRNHAGIQPIQPLLQKVDAIKDRKELINVIISLHTMGIDPFFSKSVEPHPLNNSHYLFLLFEGGLNLPDYEIYLPEKDTEANKHAIKRLAYFEYLKKIFLMTGYRQEAATAAANHSLKVETLLAKQHLEKEKRRDPDVTINLRTPAELKKLCPSIQWETFFAHLKIKPTELDIKNVNFFAELSGVVDKISLEEAKDYLKAGILSGFASVLDENFFQAQFHLYSTVLNGIKEPRPLDERATNLVSDSLGDALGTLYVKKHFPPEKKQKVLNMVEGVKEALVNRIKTLNWMQPTTKEKAIEKVRKMIVLIGYPDEGYWTDYKPLTGVTKQKSLAENLIAVTQFRLQDELKDVGLPVDKRKWPWPPQIVNACNCPNENKIVFPAGILQYPFIANDDPVSWGAFGMVIAHEIIHSFDDQGRKYDAAGNKGDWWQKDDANAFEKHAKVIEEQFNDYTLTFEDGTSKCVNGKMCLGENIADLGGLTMAYDAFLKAEEKSPSKTIHGFTPQQRFFLGYAQLWRMKITDECAQHLLSNDPHSPGKYRVNGPLSQLQIFKEAFSLPDRCAMVIPKEKRSQMWN